LMLICKKQKPNALEYELNIHDLAILQESDDVTEFFNIGDKVSIMLNIVSCSRKFILVCNTITDKVSWITAFNSLLEELRIEQNLKQITNKPDRLEQFYERSLRYLRCELNVKNFKPTRLAFTKSRIFTLNLRLSIEGGPPQTQVNENKEEKNTTKKSTPRLTNKSVKKSDKKSLKIGNDKKL